MKNPTLDQDWCRKALDEFAGINGRQNEALIMETSTVLLHPFLALLDELITNSKGLSKEKLDYLLAKREEFLGHIERTLTSARSRALVNTPSQVRVQALIDKLRKDKEVPQ